MPLTPDEQAELDAALADQAAARASIPAPAVAQGGGEPVPVSLLARHFSPQQLQAMVDAAPVSTALVRDQPAQPATPAASPLGEKVATFRFGADGAGGQAADDAAWAAATSPNAGASPASGGLTPAEAAELEAAQEDQAAELAKSAPVKTEKPTEESRLSQLAEWAWPTKTEAQGGKINPELEQLPDWYGMPELRSHLNGSPQAVLGSLIAGKDETRAILQKQFPSLKFEDRGAYWTAKSEDGNTYAWKPGPRWSDAFRAAVAAPVAAVGAGVAGLGAGLIGPGVALSALGSTLAGAGTLEGLKAAAGGGFDPLNVVAAPLVHQAVSGVGSGVGSVARSVGNAIGLGGEMTQEQLGRVMARAGRTGEQSVAQTVADQVRPNLDVVDAAKALPGRDGQPLLTSLTPGHVSDNPIYQRLERAIPGASGPEGRDSEALSALADTLDQSIKQSGGGRPTGALERTAKAAVLKQLDDQQALVNDLHAKVYGKGGVGGLVPADTDTPVPKFREAFERLKANEKGELPKSFDKVWKDLFRSGSDVPTQATVDRTRRFLGAAKVGAKSPYKDLGQAAAHTLWEALSEDQLQPAINAGGEASKLAQMAKVESQTFKTMDGVARSVLGKNLEKSFTDMLRSEVEGLPHGDEQAFNNALSLVPDSMRPDLVKASMYQFIKDGKLDLQNFNQFADAMKSNPQSWNAMKMYLGSDLSKNFQRMATVSESLQTAMGRARPQFATAFPQKLTLPELARNLLSKGTKVATLAATPGPEFLKFGLVDYLFGDRTPLKEVMEDFLGSALGRQAIEESASGVVRPAIIRQLSQSLNARRVTDALRIPSSKAADWWREQFQPQKQEGAK